MRFAIAAAALTLVGTALAAEPVAQVFLSTHDVCHEGEMPRKEYKSDKMAHASATRDGCAKMKINHSKDLQTTGFSVTIQSITHPTTLDCTSVGIYANDRCVGEADVVIPWSYDEVITQSQCFSSLPFQDTKYLSVKLFCQDEPTGRDGDEDATTIADLAKAKAAQAKADGMADSD
ncbi:hypothetical protein ATEIFO6365_0003056400 [Aspergillus terreus]|uniref:Uncharacterized protein n=1 Tax=Aspergillus terreus TaxID=33178 RepID=A0A5M3YRY4_ASPTE|nr:hypothetical protein ATETN484_0003050900 [Aspergillus terreus]GFF14498.1 hypothetical protein ATEIFO6365_0003056400 [Aspergillus terreus]